MDRPTDDIHFSWKEARYIDLWIIPHILAGSALAFFFLWVGGLRALSYGITFLLLAGWELGEGIFRIQETQENRVLDVVMGIFGFVIAYEIGRLTLGMEEVFSLLLFNLIVLLLLTLFGWLDYRRRKRES